MDDPLSSMMQDALDIGLENLEILRLAKAWCEHATMSGGMGVGLLEQATGLPINGGSLRCDYAKAPPQLIGMQLAHSALTFYEANCIGCTYRVPGGEEPNLATWALEQRQQRDDEDARLERERADESTRRDQRHQARRRRLSSTSAPVAQILDLIERIDAEHPDAQATKDLLILADQEPKSFHDDVLLDLRETAVAVRDDALMDAVLLVHERRGSSDADLLPIAIEAMGYGLATSRSGAIIARAAEALDPDPAVLERIIEVAGGTGHIIGGGERVPEPAALIRMFDLEPGAVLARLRALAMLDDRWARAQALRAAEQLIIARPTMADDLMPSVLDSLVMEDDSSAYPAPFAAAAARKAVGAALWASPEQSDRLIQERWSGAGVRERRRYLECYRPPWRRDDVPRATTSLIARRALEALESEDDELLRLAAETLDRVCRGGPDAVDLPTADLLAALARLAERTDALAVQPVDPDPLAAMGQQSQLMTHEFTLGKVRDAIAGLGKAHPDALVGIVAVAWEAAPSKSRARIVLVEILEEALKDQQGLALALPFISEVLERGERTEKRAALNVLEVTSRWSGFSLPPLVSERVLACLENPLLAKYAANLLDALDIPDERVTRVLESLLTACRFPLVERGIDHRLYNTYAAVLRFSRTTPYAARVQEILFDAVDMMYTTDAAELLSHLLPKEHPRWLPAAVRALHRDEDAQWWGVKDRDQDDLLRAIVGEGDAARAYQEALVAVALERLAMRGPHQAREIADVLASIGEHDAAATVSGAVLASIPDVPEKRGRRHHAHLIEVAHAIEAAIERSDADARLSLSGSIPADEPASAAWGFEDLPFDISEPDPAQDLAARVRLRGTTVDSLTALAAGGTQELSGLVAENRSLIGADREGTVTWAYVELLDALEHATQWRPARRRAEKDADRFREAARDRAREVVLKRGSQSWPEALDDAARELAALDDPLGGVQRAAASLARTPVPFTSTSILTESERWRAGRVEEEPERVVILGFALDGVPVTTLDDVPRNTLLPLDATVKLTGGWPDDAQGIRISFVSDTTQRDLERGEIVITRGTNAGGTRVNLRANVPRDHPVELSAAATFEGGPNVAAPRLLGVTRLRLTTAATTAARPGTESEEAPGVPPQPRRRGRPKGTVTVTRTEIVGKFRALRTNYGRNPTQQELADNVKPRIEVRTLQDHLTAYNLPWPIE